MTAIRIILLTVTLVVTLCGVVQAADTLRTPFVIANGQLLNCVVTNFGTSPITIVVTLLDMAGTVITPDFDNCNGSPFVAGTTCQVVASGIGNDNAFCTVVSSSNTVRAAIEVFTPTLVPTLITVIPATK